ncbi:ester cyclase [Sinosporangium siamense]|uniref:Ester cyclase n=1 Tax=Sinosporangium siamense TaxID=1367973 RepID=A0A919VA22_9ACTN|nr:ester cyclase [Sinosporangium siamense]GII95971.1 hypothetical protein Ssi02_62020 [Sinosporangium siamense]
MSTESNKAVARRLYEEVITNHRPELVDEIVAEDVVDETLGADAVALAREGFRQHVEGVWATVKDVKASVLDTVAEDDRVVVFWRIEGVQQGPLFGVPPTGRHFVGHSISTITFRDGKIVRYRVLPDRLGIQSQLLEPRA